MNNFVDWDELKRVYQNGHESLEEACAKYGIPLSAVLLKAKQDDWGLREAGLFAGEEFKVIFDKDPLSQNDVELAHKTDLGNLRLLSNLVIKQLQFATDPSEVLKVTEKLAKIYSQIIPLERKVMGIEDGGDDSPDGISIHMHTGKG